MLHIYKKEEGGGKERGKITKQDSKENCEPQKSIRSIH